MRRVVAGDDVRDVVLAEVIMALKCQVKELDFM